MPDLRDAVRSLRSTPVVSLMAILSLALGIRANTAIFAVSDSLFLRTLPVRDPHQLVMLRDAAGRRTFWSNPMWEQIRERDHLFDGVFAWAGARPNLARSGQTEIVDGLWVSGRMFDLLGVPAVLGRPITDADDRPGGGPDGPAAVISYRLWQRPLGRRPRGGAGGVGGGHHLRLRAASLGRRRRRDRADADRGTRAVHDHWRHAA